MTFEVKIKTEIPFYLWFLPLIWAFGIVTKKISVESFPLLLIVLLVIVAYLAVIFRYNKIFIDQPNRQITFQKTNLFRFKKTETKTFDSIQFSYRTEKLGLRSPLTSVCKLYSGDKKIADVVADQDGWTEEEVEKVAKKLATLGIERRTEKYSDREIKINDL